MKVRSSKNNPLQVAGIEPETTYRYVSTETDDRERDRTQLSRRYSHRKPVRKERLETTVNKVSKIKENLCLMELSPRRLATSEMVMGKDKIGLDRHVPRV